MVIPPSTYRSNSFFFTSFRRCHRTNVSFSFNPPQTKLK